MAFSFLPTTPNWQNPNPQTNIDIQNQLANQQAAFQQRIAALKNKDKTTGTRSPNLNINSNSSSLAHSFADEEYQQRLRELEDWQRRNEKAQQNDAALRDAQTKSMNFIDPILRGKTLEGTAYANLGQDLSADKLGALYREDFNPQQARLAEMGLVGSGAEADAIERSRDRVALYNEGNKADEQKFLLDFATSIPGRVGLGNAPTDIGSINDLGNALSLAQQGDSNLFSRRMAINSFNEDKRRYENDRLEQIRQEMEAKRAIAPNPADFISAQQGWGGQDPANRLMDMADTLYKRSKPNLTGRQLTDPFNDMDGVLRNASVQTAMQMMGLGPVQSTMGLPASYLMNQTGNIADLDRELMRNKTKKPRKFGNNPYADKFGGSGSIPEGTTISTDGSASLAPKTT